MKIKFSFHRTLLLILFFIPVICLPQNTVNNPWLVWYPELSGGARSDAPFSAFSINANTNTIADKIGNGINGAGRCDSYTIGNDLRGYVYYVTWGRQIKIIDPRNQVIVGTIPYTTLISANGISYWDPHSIYGFYISATNRHYIAVSGVGVALSELAIAIFDVTDPAKVILAKNITIPASLICVQNNLAISSGASASRMTGMALYQSSYTSDKTQLFCVVDDGTKAGSLITLGLKGANINNHPGVWLDISDPLNQDPKINVHETFYTENSTAGAIYPTTSYNMGGAHQIVYNKIVDQVYISSSQYNAILAFNAGGSSGNYNASNVIYSKSPEKITTETTSKARFGFHSIYVNKSGTAIYTGTAGEIKKGEDRAIKFTIRPNAKDVTYVNEAASSVSFSVAMGIGSVDQDSVSNVMSTNFSPDEKHLYSALFNSNYQGIDQVLSINPETLELIQPLQKYGGGSAYFSSIDTHSYAFTLSDFSDGPQSYGIASHNLVNDNYVEDKLHIGALIDGDTTATPSLYCTGDDNQKTGGSGNGLNIDEDGVTPTIKNALIGLWRGMSKTMAAYSIRGIAIKNTSPNPAILAGWIDFNHDGIFTSAEGCSVTIPIGSTTADLTWTIPPDVNTGPVILRLRLSTDAALSAATPVLPMIDGEVEDHLITTTTPVSGNVFNDVNSNSIYGKNGQPGSGEIGAVTGVKLYAYLVKDGVIIDSASVNTNGSYSLVNAPKNADEATIIIGSNSIPTGSPATAIRDIATYPPKGWIYTGASSNMQLNSKTGFPVISLNDTDLSNQNFGLQNSFVILPVKLENFTVTARGNNVLLKWDITEQSNIAGFQIAHSYDGLNFSTLNVQSATGKHYYSEVHNNPGQGLNYYRLTFWDKDGKISAAENRTVFLANNNVRPFISPNPAKSSTRITLPDSWKSRKLSISVFSATGNIVLQQLKTINEPVVTLDTEGYAAGIYFICLNNLAGTLYSEKLLVVK